MGLFQFIKSLIPQKLSLGFMGTSRITITNLGFVTINGSRYKRVKIRLVNANKIDSHLDNLLDEISALKKSMDELDKKNQSLQTLNINLSFENDKVMKKILTLEADLTNKHELHIRKYQNENEQMKNTIRNRTSSLRISTEKVQQAQDGKAKSS